MIQIITKKRNPFLILDFFFRLIVLIFFVMLIGAAIIMFLINKSQKNLEELKYKVNEYEKKAGITEMKIIVNKYERKTKDIKALKADYLFPSNFLKWLEKNTYSKIYFSDIKLNLDEKSFSVTGFAPDYLTVFNQIKFFEKNSNIKNVEISSLNIDKSRRVEFSLMVNFLPDLIK